MPDAKPPLDGLIVVDFATTRAELGGRVLAELGAEVFKHFRVEHWVSSVAAEFNTGG